MRENSNTLSKYVLKCVTKRKCNYATLLGIFNHKTGGHLEEHFQLFRGVNGSPVW